MLCINFDKKWFGLLFGQFVFTNSSGHRGREQQQQKESKIFRVRLP
jgi:hypothetical protein